MSWAVGTPGAPVRVFFSGADAEAQARANKRDGEVVGQANADAGMTLDAQGVAHAYIRPGPALAEAKVSKLAELAAARWSASSVMTYAGRAGVASDDTAQTRLTATITLMTSISGLTSSVQWEVVRGTFVAMNLNALKAFAVAMGQHVQACWTKAQGLTVTINAATTVAAVQAVDVQSGWPS